MEMYLPYQYQSISILLHSKPEQSVLQCQMESVTQVTEV